MKKKMFRLMLIALIAVLCFSTVILAACNKDGDDKDKDDTPKPQSVSTTTMMQEIINNLKGSYNLGASFGADVEAAFVIDDKTSANKDVAYKLNVKGNVDGSTNYKETDTNFVIEFTKEYGETVEVLFGIAYEVIDDQPYFFINLFNSEYRKINGYSLASLYALTQKGEASTQVSVGGINLDVDTLLPILSAVLFGSKGTVFNNAYTFNFNLYNVYSAIMGYKSAILGALSELADITEEDVNAMVEQYLGDLYYENAKGDKLYVTDLDSLGNFLRRGMAFNGMLVFNFNEQKVFQSANISFDYSLRGEDKANYTFSVDKAFVGATETAIDTFKDFNNRISAEDRASAQAVNILNFSLNGTATGYDANGNVAHNYTIEVQSDIDAFALLGLINNTSKENILSVLKSLGYLHLEINEVFENKDPLNIIALHSKFEEGFAVVNVNAYKAVLYQVGLGGVYDFDALIDVIGMLGEGNDDGGSGEGGDGEESKIDFNKIIDTVKDVIGFFTFDNIGENGVTVELKDLVYMICGMVGIDTSDSITGMGLDAIIGSNSMNIKLSTPTFGTCTTVETDTLVCGIRAASALSAGKNDFIKEIKSLDGFSGKMLQGEGNFVKFSSDLQFDKAFPITGINLKGEQVTTSGFVMGAKGLDINKPGKQNVTLYIAIANDMLDFARAGFSFGDLIPLSGALKFETEIEVIAFNKDAEVSVTNIKTDEQKDIVGNKKVFDLIRVKSSVATDIVIGNIGTYKVDLSMIKLFDKEADGKDVTADVIDEDGKFTKAGTYYAKIMFGGYTANACKISVENAYAVRADGKEEQSEIALGGTWNFDEYKVFAVGADGKATEVTMTPQYKVSLTYPLDQIFDIDNGVYTLKKNLDWVGKNFTISFANVNTPAGQKKTVNVDIPITSNYSFSKYSTLYFGNSINGAASVTIDGVEYKVVVDANGKWSAVAQNGTKKDVTMTMTWGSTTGDAVTFNENGYISNYPNASKAGSRYTRIYYSFDIDGYYYNGNFNAYELYASNKTSGVTANETTLNGFISYVDRIGYVDPATGEPAKLEFKYGANGYAIYAKDTDTKVYDVNVTVMLNNEEVQLVDGKFSAAGKYRVTYSLTINGAAQNFFHDVTVK